MRLVVGLILSRWAHNLRVRCDVRGAGGLVDIVLRFLLPGLRGTLRCGGDFVMTNISQAQRRVWRNKLAQGFNTTDVPLEFALLTAEVGEAVTAWRKGLPDLGAELADVVIYALSIAEMCGLDLEAEIAAKMDVNEARVYGRDGRGVPVRMEK